MDAKKTLIAVIGFGAFIVGGLMSRQTAIEGIELLEDKMQNLRDRYKDSDEPSE